MNYRQFMELIVEAPPITALSGETATSATPETTGQIIDPWFLASSSAIPPMEITDFDISAPEQETETSTEPTEKKESEIPGFLADPTKASPAPQMDTSDEIKDPDKEFKPDNEENKLETASDEAIDAAEDETNKPDEEKPEEEKKPEAISLAVKAKMDSLGKEALSNFKAILNDKEKMKLLYAKIEKVGMEKTLNSFVKDLFVKQLTTEKDKMFVMVNLDKFVQLVMELVLGELL
jgi:hypothetical protein